MRPEARYRATLSQSVPESNEQKDKSYIKKARLTPGIEVCKEKRPNASK